MKESDLKPKISFGIDEDKNEQNKNKESKIQKAVSLINKRDLDYSLIKPNRIKIKIKKVKSIETDSKSKYSKDVNIKKIAETLKKVNNQDLENLVNYSDESDSD